MRSWLHRHPNAAVVILAILWVLQVITIAANWAHGDWFLVVIGVAFALWVTLQLAKWWEQT